MIIYTWILKAYVDRTSTMTPDDTGAFLTDCPIKGTDLCQYYHLGYGDGAPMTLGGLLSIPVRLSERRWGASQATGSTKSYPFSHARDDFTGSIGTKHLRQAEMGRN
jgi:hypothetical protein